MKRGTPRHPKMYELAARLGIPLPYAVGIMEMLWHHAGQHTPRGDIGSLPDEAIREACCFARKGSILSDALVAAGWLERDDKYRLILHDWPDHCEQVVVKLLENRKHDFLPIYGKSIADRKKMSRDSKPSREAMAKAKAVGNSGGGGGGGLAGFDLETAWLEFHALYPPKGQSRLVDARSLYLEMLIDCGPNAESRHVEIMRLMRERWIPSDKWARGFVMREDEFIRQRCWDETPEPSPRYAATMARQSAAQREAEDFERRYAEWERGNPGGTREQFADWSIQQYERAEGVGA